MPELDPNRWKALAIVCAAFFMTVLDVSIVNVAQWAFWVTVGVAAVGLVVTAALNRSDKLTATEEVTVAA